MRQRSQLHIALVGCGDMGPCHVWADAELAEAGATLHLAEMLDIRRDDLTVSQEGPLRYGTGSELEDFAAAALAGSQPQVSGIKAFKSSAISFPVLSSSLAGQAVRIADVESGLVGAWQQPIDDSLGFTMRVPR